MMPLITTVAVKNSQYLREITMAQRKSTLLRQFEALAKPETRRNI